MGRGLGPLQHAILADAHKRGFTSTCSGEAIVFRISTLQHKHGESRRCSVSRACRLLVKRGLLVRGTSRGAFTLSPFAIRHSPVTLRLR
jgi:hypothetical protein